MSFGPIKSNPTIRSFSVYDLEWNPYNYQLRIAGVYDGERYQSYNSIAAMLRAMLTSANRGRWFYGHAGGLADFSFLLHELVRDDRYSVRAKFSGSSAIIVDVVQGKNAWHFIDSYWLLRDSLANIGKSLGTYKTGPDENMTAEERKEWYATVPLPELRDYNHNDCVVLWQAIHNFQCEILEMGGQLQPTIASTALRLFRQRYLDQNIRTSDIVNEQARGSYFASRVEVFSSECESAYYYDINSSFPYAMTRALPGSLLTTRNHLPDFLLQSGGAPFLAWVDFTVPECDLPPIPYRIGARVFFPVGRWASWLCHVDVKLLLETGCKINRVKHVMEFESCWSMAEYATDIFDRRKKSGDSFQRLVYKYLLNSLYGKFGESSEKQVAHVNPNAKTLHRLREALEEEERARLAGEAYTGNIFRSPMPGIWLETAEKPVAHMHVPMSTTITAHARKTLYDYMVDSREVHYCDTDGFSTIDEYQVGKNLGALKLEKLIEQGWFVAPKVYRLDAQLLNKSDQWEKQVLLAAKGFSLERGNTPAQQKRAQQQFADLAAGKAIEVERMARIREMLRKGDTTPMGKIVEKRLHSQAVSKRFHYPDGQTRPWHITELESTL